MKIQRRFSKYRQSKAFSSTSHSQAFKAWQVLILNVKINNFSKGNIGVGKNRLLFLLSLGAEILINFFSLTFFVLSLRVSLKARLKGRNKILMRKLLYFFLGRSKMREISLNQIFYEKYLIMNVGIMEKPVSFPRQK